MTSTSKTVDSHVLKTHQDNNLMNIYLLACGAYWQGLASRVNLDKTSKVAEGKQAADAPTDPADQNLDLDLRPLPPHSLADLLAPDQTATKSAVWTMQSSHANGRNLFFC